MFIVVALLAISFVMGENPTMVNEITNVAMNKIIEMYIGPAVQGIITAVIPDISFDTKVAGSSVHLELFDMLFQDFSLEGINMTTVEGVGYSAIIESGNAIVNFSWSYDFDGYPHSSGKGSGQMIVGDFSGSALVSVKLNEEKKTVVKVEEININIETFVINLTAEGVVGNMISLIVGVLSPLLSDYMSDIIGELIIHATDKTAGGSSQADVYIDDHVMLTWEYVRDEKFVTEGVFSYSKCLFRPIDDGLIEIKDIPYNPVVIPEKTMSTLMQYTLEATLFNSAWYTYSKLGLFESVTTTNIFDDGRNITVSDFFEMIPALRNTYSPDEPVSIMFTCDKAGNVFVLFTGGYRVVECDILVRLTSDDLSEDARNMFQLQYDLGLSEQFATFEGRSKVGLHVYYNKHTLNSFTFNSLLEGAEVPDIKLLVQYVSALSVIPFFDDWGRHISFDLISMPGLTSSGLVMYYGGEYISIGFDVESIM